jgi:hypothetical protein
MNINQEHLKDIREFKDAYKHLLETIKAMPEGINASVYFTKLGKCVRIGELKCSIVLDEDGIAGFIDGETIVKHAGSKTIQGLPL